MTRKQKRLVLISSGLAVIGLAVGLVLFALRDNIVFFYGPTELAEKAPSPGARLRLGGLVKQGSLEREGGGSVRFTVTDLKQDVPVTYVGLLPDLFREGQGVVAEGTLGADHVFHADSVLAKHDERYMPREVADALKKQGVWREGQSAPSAAQDGAKAASAK
jgi:cytochrome c-type biogenesis protein CcmE